jgi:hypothetical protein
MDTNAKRAEARDEGPDGDHLIDVEQYAKAERDIPPGQRYRIRIDRTHFDVEKSSVTGRELLLLAGKTPPERFRLDQKLRGGQTRLVGLDQVVDLTEPGVERFMTLPLDQTEG